MSTDQKEPENNESSNDNLKEVLKQMEETWWNQESYMGFCGCCQKYSLLRPQRAGMFCENC